MLQRAERLAVKIRKNCIVDGPHGQMYAWAVDGRGRHELLDQPPPAACSFCSITAFAPQTIRFTKHGGLDSLHSKSPPLCSPRQIFRARLRACPPYPWVLSLCYELLNGDRQAALELLAQADLDNGLACETVDAATGRVKRGRLSPPVPGFSAQPGTRFTGKYLGLDHVIEIFLKSFL